MHIITPTRDNENEKVKQGVRESNNTVFPKECMEPSPFSSVSLAVSLQLPFVQS